MILQADATRLNELKRAAARSEFGAIRDLLLASVEAIEDLSRRMDCIGRAASNSSPPKKRGAPGRPARFEHLLGQAIREFGLSRLSCRDAASAMRRLDPDFGSSLNSVSNLLRKMASKGELRVVSRGTGRRPTMYEVTSRED